MKRWDIINRLIRVYGYERYLEIGIANAKCFRQIDVKQKYGVDPFRHSRGSEAFIFDSTSDEFFQRNTGKYDIIFVDGLHEAKQCTRDINNSLKVLTDGGTVVVHDLLPKTWQQQRPQEREGVWNGNVWRSWAMLRATRADLSMAVVDTDQGVGIIRVGSQALCDLPSAMSWAYFRKHRNKLMNVISKKQFLATHVR